MGKMHQISPAKPSTSTTQSENNQSSNNHPDLASNLTSSSSEFQIISPHSTSPINGNQENQFADLQLSVYSAAFDLPPDEINSKLRELIRENLELKETIHENNVAMNDQCERLATWQEEVKLTQRQHKAKFEETRMVIQRLYAQNMELQQNLQEQLNKNKIEDSNAEEIVNLQKQLLEKNAEVETLRKENERMTVLELQMKNELTTVAETLNQTKVSRSRLMVEKQDLLALNNDLQTQVEAMKQSLSNMQMSEAEMAGSMTNENLQQSYVMVQPQSSAKEGNASPLDEKGIKQLLQQLQAQEKVSALMEELMEERKLKALVQKELNDLKQNVAAGTLNRPSKVDGTKPKRSATSIMSSPPFEQGASVMNGLKESEMKLNTASEHVQRYKERCSGLEVRLTDYQDRLESLQVKDGNLIQQLRLEIDDLRRTLVREQKANQHDKASLTEARCQFETLLRDYQELLRSWESYEQDQANKIPGMQSVAYYEIQLKGLKEQIDSLTAQLVASEETVAATMDESNRIRSQLRVSQEEIDKIPILQAQVEVYQADFRTEREAREKLQQEKELTVRALHDLQTRYQQLNDEMHSYRRTNTVMRTGSLNRHGTGNEAAGYNRYDPGNAFHGGGAISRPLSAGMEDRRHRGQIESNVLQSSSSVAMSTVTKPPTVNQTAYLCPKCNKGFLDLQPLENHVNDCLDNDDPFL